mmetsp:Transcript_569/g.860  ORF Transcript_569/g.860 Transcript_569/m.860 type:complete len:205 (+) Transcript_569:405-1019(+)
MEENLKKLTERFPELILMSYSISGWNKLLDRGRVAVYSKATSRGFNAYKYVIYLDKPAEALSAFLFSHRAQFTRIMMQDEHAQILSKQLSPWAVSYTVNTLSFMTLTQPREFDIFCIRLKVNQSTWANLAVSPELPLKNSEAIKGEFVYLAEICEELDLHKCKLTIVHLVDPKGKIPPFLYKRIVEKRMAAMDDLLQYLTAYVF